MGIWRICKRELGLILLILLCLFCLDSVIFAKNLSNSKYRSDCKIVIEKHGLKLYLYKGDRLVKTYPIAVGKNHGDKQKVGDMRTPEGDFYIVKIHNSKDWVYDFKDGKGPIKGAYGPWFLRLYTGADRTKSGKAWTGIGIHGTHDPTSIGKMVTKGCIRMYNKDIEELKKIVKIRTPVSIKEKLDVHDRAKQPKKAKRRIEE